MDINFDAVLEGARRLEEERKRNDKSLEGPIAAIGKALESYAESVGDEKAKDAEKKRRDEEARHHPSHGIVYTLDLPPDQLANKDQVMAIESRVMQQVAQGVHPREVVYALINDPQLSTNYSIPLDGHELADVNDAQVERADVLAQQTASSDVGAALASLSLVGTDLPAGEIAEVLAAAARERVRDVLVGSGVIGPDVTRIANVAADEAADLAHAYGAPVETGLKFDGAPVVLVAQEPGVKSVDLKGSFSTINSEAA